MPGMAVTGTAGSEGTEGTERERTELSPELTVVSTVTLSVRRDPHFIISLPRVLH